MDNDFLVQNIQKAYDASTSITANDTYKVEAFKIVLARLLESQERPLSKGKVVEAEPGDGPAATQDGVAEWQRRIALKLGLTSDQVAQIYHLDNDGALRLILNTSILPKSSSLATQDIASLLSAGRVAAKFDELGTSSEIIKEEVDYYGRHDKSNYARILGKLKPNFNFNSRDKLLTPRAPGFADAASIAKKYLSVDQGAK